jgi:trans-2,3-dihydro-3-hydroxyanthranilate isomerase
MAAVARRLTWLDVFTSTPLAGNGLAVVHDADGLDAATMLALARETAQSETAFLQSATVDGADYRNRIFTMVEEIPFAGHPSLGAAVAQARAEGRAEARYHQQTVAGVQPIEVELTGDVARASMLQEPAVFGDPIEAAPVLGALGLGPADAHAELQVQPVSTGIFHLMVPVRDAVALERARPNLLRLEAVAQQTATMVLYLFVPAEDGEPVWRIPRRDRPPARCAPTSITTPARPRHRCSRASRWDGRAGWRPRSSATASRSRATA